MKSVYPTVLLVFGIAASVTFAQGETRDAAARVGVYDFASVLDAATRGTSAEVRRDEQAALAKQLSGQIAEVTAAVGKDAKVATVVRKGKVIRPKDTETVDVTFAVIRHLRLKKTARGVLHHFPSGVRSAQAFYGHNFMVDGTPVQATDKVTEAKLKEFVGKQVVVDGIWNPGEKWEPKGEERFSARPIEHGDGPTIRGDGLMAESIKPAK